MRVRIVLYLLVISLVSRPSSSQASWPVNGVPLCTKPSSQSHPILVPDGTGGAIAAWTDYRNGDSDVYAQRLGSSGFVQWTLNDVALCTATNPQEVGAIMPDGAGGAIVVWTDYRSGGFAYIYAQRVNAAGAVQWTFNGVPVCTAQDTFIKAPQLTSDGAGGAIVTWTDGRSGNNQDVYAQHVSSAGAVQWAANGVSLCTYLSNQAGSLIVPDGAGGAIVTWADDRPGGGNYDIYAQHVNAAGALQWGASGIALCNAAGTQIPDGMTSDGTGGALVTWGDGRNGIHSDIYAQRVNISGIVQWAANGVALCSALNAQTAPKIVSDGSAGAIVTWMDIRNNSHNDIYAQRVNASGTVLWTPDGVALCMASDYQWTPEIATDGAGGAIVAWYDYRSGPTDIYAQRVNATGSVQWATDGVALCAAAEDQGGQHITSDGAGGAFVAWHDQRGPGVDIYAARVIATGQLPTGVRAISPSLNVTLGENYPNPFSDETVFDLTLRQETKVIVDVFDIAGRRVRALDLGRRNSGVSRLVLDGLDDQAHALPSGVYFCRVHAAGESITKKMVIAR
jgi:hypothetical protein